MDRRGLEGEQGQGIEFFGEEVTVAGLIAGGDVLAARQSIEGDFLIVPEQACLKSGQVFLDDMTIDDLKSELQMPVAHGGPSLFTMLRTAEELSKRERRGSISNFS